MVFLYDSPLLCMVQKKQKDYIFFVDFRERCAFEKSLDATFISLLLKVVGADDIEK